MATDYNEDDLDFSSEEVQKIAKDAVELVFKSEKDQNTPYNKDKVNQYCQ